MTAPQGPPDASAAPGWIATVRPESTTLSPDRETVYAFDLEGRPISWFERGRTYKRSLASIVHGRDREDGARRRWIAGEAEARALFDRLLRRVRDAPGTSFPPTARDRLRDILRWTPAALLAEREQFDRAYRPVTILPPDQYLSIVVQATHGCTWNRCTFCNFYQDRPFETRALDDFRDHLARVAALLGRAAAMRRRIFLADGNALVLSRDRLAPIVEATRAAFPDRPLAGFVDVISGERKPESDWRELAGLGLERVYVGLETGHDPLLAFVDKPGTAAEAVEFVATLKRTGMSVGLIAMCGLGGARFADGHVRDTLAVLASMPLGPGDLVYLSPFVEHAESAYAARAREQGIEALDASACDAQAAALREGLRDRLPGVQVARYDIREFVY